MIESAREDTPESDYLPRITRIHADEYYGRRRRFGLQSFWPRKGTKRRDKILRRVDWVRNPYAIILSRGLLHRELYTRNRSSLFRTSREVIFTLAAVYAISASSLTGRAGKAENTL